MRKQTMKTKLVSLTKSLIAEKELSSEELIVYIARVSNPSNQLNTETSDRLIRYMIKHAHWSPFEMVDMTIEITTSRAIAAQMLRHRSFSFQEFSQRYSEAVDIEPIELRKAGATNRQSSLEVVDESLNETAHKLITAYFREGMQLYRSLLDAGVAKECARFVLPLATQTRIYMKGSVRSWIHYLKIRCDEHTQLEHRLIAESIKEIFKDNFPEISKALGF